MLSFFQEDFFSSSSAHCLVFGFICDWHLTLHWSYVSFAKTWKPCPLSLIFLMSKPMWKEPNILQIPRDEFHQKNLSALLIMCGYRSRVMATFANEISTSVKIQLGIRSRNNVSFINLFYIAFLNSHYLIYERELSWIYPMTAAKQVHLLSFTHSGNFRRRDINNIGKNTTRHSITNYC